MTPKLTIVIEIRYLITSRPNFRVLVDDAKGPLPKDQLLFRMAEELEADGKLQEARQTYVRFLDEFPTSSLRNEVEQRSELLELRLEASPA